MKNIERLSVIYVFYLLVSCSQTPAVGEHEIVTFDRSDFLTESVLIADTIEFDKPLWPKAFLIIRDTIILVSNWTNNEIGLELYHLETKDLLGFAAPKGRGPGEYLACYPIYNSGYARDTIQIYDPVGNQFSLISIDSLLKHFEKTEPLISYDVPYFVKFPALIGPTRLVGWNFNFFKYQEIDNGFDRLFMVDYSVNPNPTEKLDSKNYYSAINFSSGHTIVNQAKDRIIVADRFNAAIYIYTTEVDQIKELRGPDQFDIEYNINHESRKVSFAKGKRCFTYSQICYTKDAIYITYEGAINISGVPQGPAEVFKLSWDGDLLHRYQLDQNVIRISVDSKEEFLYASSYNPDEYPKLLRYRLK